VCCKSGNGAWRPQVLTLLRLASARIFTSSFHCPRHSLQFCTLQWLLDSREQRAANASAFNGQNPVRGCLDRSRDDYILEQPEPEHDVRDSVLGRCKAAQAFWTIGGADRNQTPSAGIGFGLDCGWRFSSLVTIWVTSINRLLCGDVARRMSRDESRGAMKPCQRQSGNLRLAQPDARGQNELGRTTLCGSAGFQ
jgi:hypothetical protein